MIIVKHAQDGIDQTTPDHFASKINAWADKKIQRLKWMKKLESQRECSTISFKEWPSQVTANTVDHTCTLIWTKTLMSTSAEIWTVKETMFHHGVDTAMNVQRDMSQLSRKTVMVIQLWFQTQK